MAKKNLNGKKVAILVDEGFEQVELIKPRKALDRAVTLMLGGTSIVNAPARRRHLPIQRAMEL